MFNSRKARKENKLIEEYTDTFNVLFIGKNDGKFIFQEFCRNYSTTKRLMKVALKNNKR